MVIGLGPERHTLGPVPGADAVRAFRQPIESNGRTVSEQALKLMVGGAGGYPFMIQLVGAQTWRARPDQPAITVADARQGVANARRRLAALIHEPALRADSDIDRAFLRAMADDDGPSRMADIQERLGVDTNYARQYRLRLIATELICAPRRGYVDFALPYLANISANTSSPTADRLRRSRWWRIRATTPGVIRRSAWFGGRRLMRDIAARMDRYGAGWNVADLPMPARS